MIDYVTSEGLDRLIADGQPPCLSIYLPMERMGAETQQNSLRFKGAVGQATNELLERGMRRPDVETLLEPVARLVDDHQYWQQQDDGLAVFVDGSGERRYRLPLSFEERVVVGDRFHVKPLMPYLTDDGEFYVLALSHNEVRLLRGSKWQVSEIDMGDVPTSFEEALWYKDPEPFVQGHTTQRGGGIVFHGHGFGEGASDEDLKVFFRQVDAAVTEVMPTPETPVVLAGVDHLHPVYREVSNLFVVEEGIEGNPERLSPEELHERAWPMVDQLFRERRERAAERIGAAGTSSSLDDVVMGAAQGRIDTLFVPARQQQFGRYDPETMQVSLDDDGVDLYDLAAVETWRHRGQVYAVEPEDMPGGGEVAAVFRY